MRNIKFLYYASNYIQLFLPNSLYSLDRELAKFDKLTEQKQSEVIDRVNYYCKLSDNSTLSNSAAMLSENPRKEINYGTTYFFDSYAISRYFDKNLKWQYRFGDTREDFEYPTIVKSRSLSPQNINSVILKLNKVRHYNFVKDSRPYEKKDDKIVYRGFVRKKQHRVDLIQRYFDHPMCDFGATDKGQNIIDLGITKERLSIKEQLKSKFIVAIEGNDVATNLKWIMNSNSVAVMARPTCETWFMEGRLVGGEHYIEVNDDYSNLEERINYYLDHPILVKEIIHNANQYIKQFLDKDQERLISLMVLQRYFEKSRQL